MKAKLLFLLLFINGQILICHSTSFAQCTGAVANTGGTTSITPTTSWQTVVFKSGDVRYIEFSATTGNTYVFSCRSAVGGSAAGVDEQFSLLTTANAAAGGVYSTSFMDDFASGTKELFSWSPSSNGTYRIVLSLYSGSSCQSLTSDYTVAYTTFGEIENYCFWMGVTDTDWADGNNWYRRAAAGYPSRSVPTSAYNVTIPSGSSNQPNISSTTIADCDNLTINAGATLTNAATALGLGDLDIYGNFTNNGTFNHSGDVYTDMKSTGNLSGTGTFTTTGIYIFDETVTLTSSITIQDLKIYNDGVTFLNLGSNTLTVTNYLDQSGTLNLGTGTLSYSGTDGNLTLTNSRFTENSGTFEYSRAGAQTVLGAITYNHLEIDGSGTKTLNANTDVNGNLTITAGTLASASTYDITLAGSWTNNGAGFTHASRKVTFDGGAAQTISGSTTTTFHDLTIANTSGNVALSVDATINGTLTMTTGDLVIATAKTLTIDDTDDPGISGGSSATHIVTSGTATIQKTYTSTTAITFPLGNGTYYRPLTLTPSNANSTIWTVGYTPAVHSNTAVQDESPSTSLNHISPSEWWTCNRGGGTPSDATMALTWHDGLDVDDYANLRLAHYDGATDWNLVASSPVGDDNSGTLTSSAAVSIFSPFTIGSINGNNPLPIELLSFESECLDNEIHLTWSTASEINNDYFTLEKSADGNYFETLVTIAGSGTKNSVSNYSFNDNATATGNVYYRLKQTDYDGKSEYFDIITENCGNNPENFIITPIKTSGSIEVSYLGSETGRYTINISNHLGQLIYSGVHTFSENSKSEIPIQNFAKGIYFIHVYNGVEVVSKKTIL